MATKKQHSYKLIGLTRDNTPAKTAADVVVFKSPDGYFRIMTGFGKTCMVATPKGVYELPFQNGRYEGICNQHKVHVCLKKIVGTVHTWF